MSFSASNLGQYMFYDYDRHNRWVDYNQQQSMLDNHLREMYWGQVSARRDVPTREAQIYAGYRTNEYSGQPKGLSAKAMRQQATATYESWLNPSLTERGRTYRQKGGALTGGSQYPKGFAQMGQQLYGAGRKPKPKSKKAKKK